VTYYAWDNEPDQDQGDFAGFFYNVAGYFHNNEVFENPATYEVVGYTQHLICYFSGMTLTFRTADGIACPDYTNYLGLGCSFDF
jgi:hypothetical protein